MIIGLVVVFLCTVVDFSVVSSTFPDAALHLNVQHIGGKTDESATRQQAGSKHTVKRSLGHFRRAKTSVLNLASAAIPAACTPDEQHENPPVPLNYSQTPSPALSETSFIAECDMPTEFGRFRMRSYTHLPIADNSFSPSFKSKKVRLTLPNERVLEPVVLVYGNITAGKPVLLRVHDQCITSEVFHSLRCDCREQLWAAMKDIVERVDGKRVKDDGEEEYSAGVIIYLQQEGRGLGLPLKIRAYALQDEGEDTVTANLKLGFPEEMREYSCVPPILVDLGILAQKSDGPGPSYTSLSPLTLLTNNPYKVEGLGKVGVEVKGRQSLIVPPRANNEKYLRTKREKMGHWLTEDHKDATVIPEANNTPKKWHETHTYPPPPPLRPYPPSEPLPVPSDFLPDPASYKNILTLQPGYLMGRNHVCQVIQAMSRGELGVVVDHPDREDEGDLLAIAALISQEKMGFMVRHTSGVICVSMGDQALQKLKLPPMVTHNEDPKGTAYSVTVDYLHPSYNKGSTGISAKDRAFTTRALAINSGDSTQSMPRNGVSALPVEYFQRPGHVFPLRARQGGVLTRGGHTEASYDLSVMGGWGDMPGGALGEVVDDAGELMRGKELMKWAKTNNLPVCSIQDIIAYKLECIYKGLYGRDEGLREMVSQLYRQHGYVPPE